MKLKHIAFTLNPNSLPLRSLQLLRTRFGMKVISTRRQYTVIWLLPAMLLISACGENIPFAPRGADTALLPIQNCALGYDLAQQIYAHVALRRTVLVSKARPGSCQAHALRYLRQAGFAIDETGAAPNFKIDVRAASDGEIIAVARIGDTVAISRAYTLAPTGVRAVSAVSVIHIDQTRADWRPVGQARKLQASVSGSPQRRDR